MVTIEIDSKTKAGKALIETARLMAQKFRGITITEENSVLVERIRKNHQNDLLDETEKTLFLEELNNLVTPLFMNLKNHSSGTSGS